MLSSHLAAASPLRIEERLRAADRARLARVATGGRSGRPARLLLPPWLATALREGVRRRTATTPRSTACCA